MPEVTLEAEEWYVLAGWLRERENRLMYALRPRSDEWEFVHDLRQTIERQQDGTTEAAKATEGAEVTRGAETTETAGTTGTTESAETTEVAETAGTTETVRLSTRQTAYLSSFLQRRARKLLLFPWRNRERRDVRHLRDHLLHEAG